MAHRSARRRRDPRRQVRVCREAARAHRARVARGRGRARERWATDGRLQSAFRPTREALRTELDGVGGRALVARVNAGPLPEDHWLHDPAEGGGRLLGEACHFVDLLRHLAGSRILSVHAVASPHTERPLECSDNAVATLRLADGTVATLVYAGSGDPRLPKERVEAFGGGLAAVLDDLRRLELYRGGRRTVVKQRQDKGHRAEVARFLAAAVRGDAEPPPVEPTLNSTRATLAIVESLRIGLPVTMR